MSMPAYIRIVGATQGEITQGSSTVESIGNTWQEGYEDWMMVQAIEHNITLPRDPQSGQPTGQRVHGPFRFTTTLTKGTPLLYNALTSGEMLTYVAVNWFRTNSLGKREYFFATVMNDAIIVDIDCKLPHAQIVENADFTQLLTVSLSYRAIAWHHYGAGTSGNDDWRAPVA